MLDGESAQALRTTAQGGGGGGGAIFLVFALKLLSSFVALEQHM